MSHGCLWVRLGNSMRMMNYCERSGSRKPTLSRSQPFQFVPCFEQSPFDSRSVRQPANATGRDRSERDRSANATGRDRPPRDRSANATGPNATGPRTRQTAICDRSRIMNYECHAVDDRRLDNVSVRPGQPADPYTFHCQKSFGLIHSISEKRAVGWPESERSRERDRSERDRSANATGRDRSPCDRSANATGPNATGPRMRQVATARLRQTPRTRQVRTRQLLNGERSRTAHSERMCERERLSCRGPVAQPSSARGP